MSYLLNKLRSKILFKIKVSFLIIKHALIKFLSAKKYILIINSNHFIFQLNSNYLHILMEIFSFFKALYQVI